MRKTIWILAAFFMVYSSLFSGRKVYWHIEMNCFSEYRFRDKATYRQDETVWITLVEIEKSRAYPAISNAIEARGGESEGTLLAFVRGAAYRKGVTVEVPVCCKHGAFGCARPGVARMSWNDSWAEPVYATGQIYENRKGVNVEGPAFVKIHFVPKRVLLPDGNWRRIGPTVVVEGGRGSEVLSSSKIVYNSPYTYYSTCGKEKRKQYRSLFNRHWSFKTPVIRIGGADLNLYEVIPNRVWCQYTISRSHSPRHPSWKRLL